MLGFEASCFLEAHAVHGLGPNRGLKERYAAYHGVQVSDRALVMAAELGDRYITNRFLPDKVHTSLCVYCTVL